LKPPRTRPFDNTSDSAASPPLQREFDFATPRQLGSSPSPAPPLESESSPPSSNEELTGVARSLLTSIGETRLAGSVEASWNPRLRTTAGRAFRHYALVEVNPALLQVSAAEVDRTLKHELAHLVAYRRARGRKIEPHGPEWKAACAELGIPGEDRCHNLSFPRIRQRRKYAYRCPNCTKEIFRVRRIRGEAACYDCCRAYNGGRFSSSFVLLERRLHPGENNL